MHYSREPLATPTPPPEPTGTGERLTPTGNPRRVSYVVLHRQPTPGHSRHYASFAAHGAHRGTRNREPQPDKTHQNPLFCPGAVLPQHQNAKPRHREPGATTMYFCVSVSFFRSREPGRGVLCTILPTTTPGNCVPALLTEPTRPRPATVD